jgi:hypothetical protein
MAHVRIEFARWGVNVKGFEFRGGVRAIVRQVQARRAAAWCVGASGTSGPGPPARR